MGGIKYILYIFLNLLTNYFYFKIFVGDEIDPVCWEQKPSILSWMNENNINDYTDLFFYYINRTRKMLDP